MNKLSLGLAALLTSTSVHALDSAGDIESVEIEEIKVTATRTPISADSATTLVSVITKDDLAKQQIFQVADYLKNVSGISIASSGSLGGQAQLRMRGAEANQTLVLIDGIEMNDPAAGDEFQFEHLTINEIERIEIIRSPMSATWGSDALAGVINIITRQADAPQSISAFVEYGSFDTLKAGGRFAASGDRWKLSIGTSHMKSDGTNISRTGDELDGYTNTSVNVRSSLSISENVNFAFSLRHSETMSEFDATDWMTGLAGDSDNSSDTNKTAFSARLNNSAFDGRLNQSLRLTLLDTKVASFAFGSESGTTGASKLGIYFDNQIALSKGHVLTLAIDHEDTDFTQSGDASFWGDPNQKQNQKNTGYLADYVGDITGALTISASLRYDDNSAFNNVTSWRAGASYKITDSTRLFMSTSKGQKSPTFIERFGYFSSSFQGNLNLKPEQSKGYEIGMEQTVGNFSMSAAYFNTDLTDEINGFFFDTKTFNFTAVNKQGESKRQGFELMLEGELSDIFSFSTNYTYIDSTEDDGAGEQVRELRRPKHMATLSLNAELSDRINISASLNHTGKSLDVFYPPWPNPSERVDLDAYTMLRIAANYKVTDAISLYGRVENAFNENYENVYGFGTPNRSAYMGMRANF